MRRKNAWLAAALAVALSAGAGAALASGARGHCDGFGAPRAVYRLDDLSAEQRARLDQVFVSRRAGGQELRATWRANRQELEEALRAGAGPDVIRPLAERQGEQLTRMILWRAETRAAVNGILSEDQRQRLAELRDRGIRRGRDHDRW
jgi:hypothetical protein